MDYKIIDVHIVYRENKISEIAVLWQSNEAGWVRSTYFTDKPCAGYGHLKAGEILSPQLINEVAALGRYLPDTKKKLYFPDKRMWER
jgi:hypothetical protein